MAAEVSMTPGKSLLIKTAGNERAPVAITTFLARKRSNCLLFAAITKLPSKTLFASQSGITRTSVCACKSAIKRSFSASPPPSQFNDPPMTGFLSNKQTDWPLLAALMAALIPAGPPPTTATSQKSFTFVRHYCRRLDIHRS